MKSHHRFWLSAIVLLTAGIGWYAAFGDPRPPIPISRYGDLQEHVGRHVTFRAVFDEDYKPFSLVYVEGRAVGIVHGSRGWSPRRGEECRVTGVINRFRGVIDDRARGVVRIEYGLTNATYYPADAPRSTN